MLTDRKIDYIVGGLRAIEHIEIIRIGTRVPVTLPQRITPELCAILKKHHPFYINTHFNHPREITPETTEACERLADAGIPIGNQCVLLRGVNDDPAVMVELMKKLLQNPCETLLYLSGRSRLWNRSLPHVCTKRT